MTPSNPPDSPGFWNTRWRRWLILTSPLYLPVVILFMHVMVIGVCTLTFDHNARYVTSRNNLAASRSAISLYKSKSLSFAQPTESGGTMATRSGAHTLEAILTNANGKGNGRDYIRNYLGPEHISISKGNNFVCIVNSEEEFYKDQSDFSNCQGITKHEKPEGRGGGYVYCPVNGKLRLNFYVNGDDLRSEGQLHIHVLYPEWAGWIKEQSSASKQELETDWPVRW